MKRDDSPGRLAVELRSIADRLEDLERHKQQYLADAAALLASFAAPAEPATSPAPEPEPPKRRGRRPQAAEPDPPKPAGPVGVLDREDPGGSRNGFVELPTDAENRAAAKRERDRAYRERKRAEAERTRLAGAWEPAGEPNGAATEAATAAPELFVFWGQGAKGKRTNPVYGIRAASIDAAVAYVRSQHPLTEAEAIAAVGVDQGEVAERGLPVRDLVGMTAKPAADRANEILEGQRRWQVYDASRKAETRGGFPGVYLGEVEGANVTRAKLAAEARWPEIAPRLLEISEVGTRVRTRSGRKPATPPPAAEAERPDWRTVPTSKLKLRPATRKAVEGLGLATAGALHDWLRVAPKDRPPTGMIVGEPWPKILENCRKAIVRLRHKHGDDREPVETIYCTGCYKPRPTGEHPCPHCRNPEFSLKPIFAPPVDPDLAAARSAWNADDDAGQAAVEAGEPDLSKFHTETWRDASRGELTLSLPSAQVLDIRLKLATLGEVADWLDSVPDKPPWLVSKPWPEIVQEIRQSLDAAIASLASKPSEPAKPKRRRKAAEVPT